MHFKQRNIMMTRLIDKTLLTHRESGYIWMHFSRM